MFFTLDPLKQKILATFISKKQFCSQKAQVVNFSGLVKNNADIK